MDEIGIIGGLALLALAYAASSARWVGGRAGSDRARFLEGVLRTGAGALIARLGRVLVLPLVICAGAVFGLHLWGAESGAHAARLELAIWALASLVLGALSSWAACQIGALVSARAAARSATHGIAREEALEIALRGASASAVVAAALPLLALTVLFGVALVVLGAEDVPWVAARTLLGFPLGVALQSAAVQVGAASFAAGASDAERQLVQVEPGASTDDARNPATLASLVAIGPARAAARGAEAAETTGVELVAALLLAAQVAEASRSALGAVGVSPVAIVALPLVARAYGLLASIAGVMAVRSDEVEHPSDALARGHWVAAAIQLAGFALTSWLLLRPFWGWLSVAAAIGVAAGYGQLLVTQYLEDARYEPARSIAAAFLAPGEGRARGVSLGVARGLRGTVPPVVLLFAMIAVGHLSGETTGLARGALLGVVVAIGGFLGTSPFVQAAEGAFVSARAAEALRRLRGGMPGDESSRELVQFGTSAHSLIGASTAALLLVSAVTVEAGRLRAATSLAARSFAGLDPTLPATALAALVGALLAFWYAGRGARAVDVVRSEVLAEARRLLQWLPRDRGAVVFPPEGIPEPAGCVDVGARSAASQALRAALPVALAVGAIGAIFRWTHGVGAEAVVALAWVAVLASTPLGLAVSGAATAWSTAHRLLARAVESAEEEQETSRLRDALPDARALDELGVKLGGGVVAAASSIAKLVAAVALALLPLFV